jgi:hypothetical protein
MYETGIQNLTDVPGAGGIRICICQRSSIKLSLLISA